jgi:hypothetical protein
LVGDLRVGGLSASKAVLVASLEPPKITIALLPLIPIAKISETNMCWHSIFSHTVIAYDFPIPGRHEGQGLEVTFDTMVQLTRCLRLTQYDDGLVAEGPECLLIPEKELPQDDALQWHLQWKTTRAECRKTGIPRVLTLDILADRFKSRYVTDKPEKLQNRRGFLGWTHTAHIVVGTAGFLRALRYTEQPILNEEGFHRVSHNIGFGLSALPASLTLQVQVAQAYDGNVLYHSQQVKSLRDRLDDSEKSSIIIYDTSTGTGWQIPESSVILYMVQLYIQRLYIQRGHDVLEPENETLADMSLLSAALEPDGGRAALKTLKACLDLWLSKEGQVTTLSEQVDWFLNETSSVEEFLSGALQKARKLKKSPPNCLIGVELLDVVDQKCSFGAKLVEFKKPQPWSYLSEEACLVLLCRDIGQAIVPARPETLCRNWRQVPEDQNFLVATARVIRNYLEPLGGRILSFKFLWKFTGSPIQMHTAGERRPIRHTQTLHPFSASSKMLKDPREYPQMDPEPMLSDTLDGGLIFREPKLEKSCTLIIDAPLAANIQVVSFLFLPVSS